MNRDKRDLVTDIAQALAVADTIKHGMPLSNSRELDARVTNYFNMAEIMVDERDRRFPQLKDV